MATTRYHQQPLASGPMPSGTATTSRYILRDYQSRSIEEIIQWFYDNSEGNPVAWLPTAAGKSIIVAEMCRMLLHDFEVPQRVIMIVPSKELAEQNHEKIVSLVGDDRVGVISAAMGRKDHAPDFDIIATTIGTIANYHPGNLGKVGLVIIDEAHLVPTKDQGQYRKFISALQVYNPKVRVLGLTATPYRGNGVWLHMGEDPLFSGIATRVEMSELLDRGYLSPLITGRSDMTISAEGARIDSRTGDFQIGDLARILDRDSITSRACDEMIRLGQDRKKWMVFAVTIAHAEHIQSELISRGIPAGMVSAKTPKRERGETIEAFRNGAYRALVNVAALTTGFDVPDVDLIALLRNTRSPVLYTQIAGRGMRIAEGKTDCLWCDFTDSTLQMGPIDKIQGREPGGRRGDAPKRVCPKCDTEMHAGFVECPKCGEKFPREVITHEDKVIAAPIMAASQERIIEEIEVDRVFFYRHVKRGAVGAPPTLRAEYQCGLRTFKKWLCFDHPKGSLARRKAVEWWWLHDRSQVFTVVPNSVDVALRHSDVLAKPKTIRVDVSKKYPEIIEYKF